MKLDRVMEKYMGDENADKLLDTADEFLDLLKLAVKTMKETDSFQEK
jgi:dsDNA-binding SOS-regulon protein